MSAFPLFQPTAAAFVAGLALVWAAALVVEVGRAKASWLPLAVFGLAQGLAQWTLLAPADSAHAAAFRLIRLALVAISFVALIELGRRHITRQSTPILSKWAYAPLLVIVVLIVATRQSAGFELACRYMMAPAGGLLAAFGLLRSVRRGRNVQWTTSLAGAAVAFFAIGYAFSIAPLQALAALGLLTAVWRENRQQFPLPVGASAISRWRFPLVFVVLASIGVTALTVFEQRLDEQAQNTVQVYAASGAGNGAAGANLDDFVEVDPRKLARERADAQRYKQGITVLVIVAVVAVLWVGVSRFQSAK